MDRANLPLHNDHGHFHVRNRNSCHHHNHRHSHHHHHAYRHVYPDTEISCCVKYLVFGSNILFWVIGVAIFLVGVWAQIEKNPLSQMHSKLSRFYLDPALMFIILGGLTFIIGFSGCVGALRENTSLLSLYSVLVGILLLFELTIGMLGFVFKDWVKNQLGTELNQMIVDYREDPDLQGLIDWIQMDWLKCCGINGPNDWDKNVYFNTSSAILGSPEADGVPFSCCSHPGQFVNYFCGHGVRRPGYNGEQKIYQSGCLLRAQDWINTNFTIVGSLAIAIAVLEILGICFAQNLRSDVFAQRARWEREH